MLAVSPLKYEPTSFSTSSFLRATIQFGPVAFFRRIPLRSVRHRALMRLWQSVSHWRYASDRELDLLANEISIFRFRSGGVLFRADASGLWFLSSFVLADAPDRASWCRE